MFQYDYLRNQYHIAARPDILDGRIRPGQKFQNSAWPGPDLAGHQAPARPAALLYTYIQFSLPVTQLFTYV